MKNIFPFAIIFFLAGCKKSDGEAPVITMVSPSENQVFAGVQTVTIKATITDNEGIHMIHTIVTDNTGGHLIHSEDHFDGRSYDLNKSFSTLAGRTYTIHIDATDHNDNVATKELSVSSN